MKLVIGWNTRGDLRLDDDDEDQPRIVVTFYDMPRATRRDKLELLRDMVETALMTRDLVEE